MKVNFELLDGNQRLWSEPGPRWGVLSCHGKGRGQPLNSIPGQRQNCAPVGAQTDGAVFPPLH